MKSGVIVILKPVGITSHKIIAKLRYLLGEKKIGHCGTLDPIASGILPVMVGTAVKASEYLTDHDKRYFAGIKLGITTDSEDITGNVTSVFQGELPSYEEFAEAALSFVGDIMQVPPMYSALKVGGVKLVDLAREGVTIDREERSIHIYDCVPSRNPDGFFLDVRCSRGTYIRTLCADIGKKLGCGAVMSSLRRTEVGVFRESDGIEFDSLNDMTREEIEERIIPVEQMFTSLPVAHMSDFYARLYRNGEKIMLKKLNGISGENNALFRVYSGSDFHSLGEIVFSDGIGYFHMKKLFLHPDAT